MLKIAGNLTFEENLHLKRNGIIYEYGVFIKIHNTSRYDTLVK